MCVSFHTSARNASYHSDVISYQVEPHFQENATEPPFSEPRLSP